MKLTSRRNFFGLLFGGWLMAASGLKLDAPAAPQRITAMWDEAMQLSDLEEEVFAAMQRATAMVLDGFYIERCT